MHGDVRLTGLRQMAHLSQNGEYLKAVFSLVGDNIEWAAPEVMSQVSCIYLFKNDSLHSKDIVRRIQITMKKPTCTVLG